MAIESNCCVRSWRTRRMRAACAPRAPGPARRLDRARRGQAASVALVLVLLARQVAEAVAQVLGQFLVLLAEVFAFPARELLAVEVQRQGLDLRGAAAIGALRGHVIPARVVERVGHRGRAEQRHYLALVHADLQLVDVRLLEQVPLVDRLLVEDAAARGGEGQGGEKDKLAHGAWFAWGREGADDTLRRHGTAGSPQGRAQGHPSAHADPRAAGA